MLDRLFAGGVRYENAETFSSLHIEARGGRLVISGRTPLPLLPRDRFLQTLYRYELGPEEAETLFSALRRDFGDDPLRTIAQEFEFSKAHCPLSDYLEQEQTQFDHFTAKGGVYYGD